ncbi:MAG: BREX system P-loop protein BrxC, partial [Thermodesulfobacteriota bacterium]
SVAETTQTIADMLNHRAPGKTLFIIVDEVSQHIHQNESRMLKLQSLVSDLGQKLKGRVWLLATGQKKLEDVEDNTVLGKLKDRFPPKLRVHLSPTNLRDVVHKRLLKKAPDKEAALRALFAQHRSDLKLYGYACESITEEDFVEVYPMLPGYVDLLMQITSAMRLRSTRVKGDDYAIRGLLQLLGELFREQKLGEMELGELVTLDRIYDIQHTALETDIQNTMARILAHDEVAADPQAGRVAKAVSLLEMIQEQEPTTTKAVSQCLYSSVGLGNQEPAVQKTLDRLCELGLLSYSEKEGYKIQSSAGQEWQRERDSRGVTDFEIVRALSEKLKELLGAVERPRYKKKSFMWAGFLNDSKDYQDEKLIAPLDAAVVSVDFRYYPNTEDRTASAWVQASDTQPLRDRIIWVNGQAGAIKDRIRELVRSRQIINRYSPHRASLSPNKQRLYYEEEGRRDGLEDKTRIAVAEMFMDGDIYFRGRRIDKQPYGIAFATVLQGVGESILPELFSRYVDMAVTPGELNQLLEPNLSGPSQKFMSGGLGILGLDAGKYIPICDGEIPSRILEYIKENSGVAGGTLLNEFGKPPYGHPPDVVKACLAGLLRAGKVRIRPETGAEITSVRDPGAKDMFQKDRDFKRADILPPADQGISARDRIAICKYFNTYLNVDIDRENDAIADAVFQHFPLQVSRIQDLEAKFNQLPGRPELPETIQKFRKALEDCKRSRHVEPTVLELKKHLDVVRDGTEQLGIYLSELTDETLQAVIQAMNVLENQAAQLSDIQKTGGIEAAVSTLREHLSQDRPWRDIGSVAAEIDTIKNRYKDVRLSLIERQEKLAQKIRDRIKTRNGFEKLDDDQSHHVLRPITEALYETTPEALQPTLETLRDSV